MIGSTGSEPPLTQTSRALSLFTNRVTETVRYLHHVNDTPLDRRVLFFHGDGGNGKSLLMRYLSLHFCKVFPENQWRGLAEKPREVDWVAVANGCTDTIPHSFHDFSAPAVGVDQPREPFSALLMIRRQLLRAGFRFPRFDFACLWYLRQSNQLSKERIQSLFPEKEDWIPDIVNILSAVPVVGIAAALYTFFHKRLSVDTWAAFTSHQKRVVEETVERIQQLDPQTELIESLPEFIAADINTGMEAEGHPRRLVMFFDTYEALWSAEPSYSESLFFHRDEWLRRILLGLDATKGIVVVIAGRDAPRWPKAANAPITENLIDLVLVGHFSREDAREYLAKVGLANDDERNQLIQYAQVREDQVHPLYLGLCADLAVSIERRGLPLSSALPAASSDWRQKGQLLVNRLLSYVDQETKIAVWALSASRAFDYEIYKYLLDEMDFSPSPLRFQQLTHFSFVWRLDRKVDGHSGEWYQIHELVRRLLREGIGSPDSAATDVIHQADLLLEKHFRSTADAASPWRVVEAIYHAGYIEPVRSAREWIGAFESSRSRGQHQICRALMEVRPHLEGPSTFSYRGTMSILEGIYLEETGRYSEALSKFDEALEVYRSHLANVPDEGGAVLGLGRAVLRRGELQARLSKFDLAERDFAEAIRLEEQAALSPAFGTDAEREQILVHALYGELLVAVSRTADALIQFDTAIRLATERLTRDASDWVATEHQATAMKSLADLLVQLSRYGEAESEYRTVIELLDSVIQHHPEESRPLLHKASALKRLGNLLQLTGRSEDAALALQASIEASSQLLSRSLTNVSVLNAKADALRLLGRVEFALSREESAQAHFLAAIEACDSALAQTPSNVRLMRTRGDTLVDLGNLCVEVGSYGKAELRYRGGLDSLHEALTISPNDVPLLQSDGNAHRRLADLLRVRGRTDGATKELAEAIRVLDKALAQSPGSPIGLSTKGNACLALALSRIPQGLLDESEASLRQAIDCYSTVLKGAPSSIMEINNRGTAFLRWGDVALLRGNHAEADERYASAKASYEEALRLAPDFVNGLLNRALALQKLAKLRSESAPPGEGARLLREAIETCDQAMAVAPESIDAVVRKASTTLDLALCSADCQAELFTETMALASTILSQHPDHIESLELRARASELRAKLPSASGPPGERRALAEASMKDVEALTVLVPENAEYARWLSRLRAELMPSQKGSPQDVR